MGDTDNSSQNVDTEGASSSSDENSFYSCYDEAAIVRCDALCSDLFGRKPTCAEIKALIGAFNGVEIKVTCGSHSAWLEPHGPVTVQALMIEAMHDFYEVPQRRAIFRGANEALIMLNEVFQVKEQAPPYTGTRVLARSVENILQYNSQVKPRYRISKLRVHAFSWSDAYNGAYTWARLGYNASLADIDPNLRARLLTAVEAPEYSDELRQAMPEVETLNDLILAGGAELWRRQGQEFWGDFELSSTSDSIRILRSYVAQRGVKI